MSLSLVSPTSALVRADDVMCILPLRFSLRRSALELFMVDRSNFFFNFGVTTPGLETYNLSYDQLLGMTSGAMSAYSAICSMQSRPW